MLSVHIIGIGCYDFALVDPEAEAKTEMRFEMVYCGTGKGQVMVESVELVHEREGGEYKAGRVFLHMVK